MKKYSILTMVLCVFISYTCMAQTKKAGTAQRKPATTQKKSTTPQRKSATSSSASAAVNDGAEISLKGHIDYLQIGNDQDDKPFQIDKKIKANYVFKVFRDPTDMMKPGRKTVILSCDIDWKALGADRDIPMDWSWSGRNIIVESQESNGTTAYAVQDGRDGVLAIIPKMKNKEGKVFDFVFAYGGGSQISDLRQGMHIDDVARQIQAEIPGTRVVITGNKIDGLTEYVLLSFGENKVYDVTGDYHYELTNDEPYFTFWTDSKDKLVKWFALKRVR